MTYSKVTLFFIFQFFILADSFSQDTFSIVAVDSITGEVGGAGATCLDIVRENATALIINDLLPGKGAIHTQSFWNSDNQINARFRMFDGLSPEEIMTWLENNDVQNNSSQRQYGAAAFDDNGSPSAAAFTGVNCFDNKYHIVGDYYAIQGNILIDSAVIDSMEAYFLKTTGTLADRLMAAMQGANIPGADSRCLDEGVSSRSSFLRVAKPDDTFNNYYLDLHVPVTPFGVEPIDSLQSAYDNWKAVNSTENGSLREETIKIFPNPTSQFATIEIENFNLTKEYLIEVADLTGKKLVEKNMEEKRLKLDLKNFNSGVYFVNLKSEEGVFLLSKKLFIN